MADLFSVIKPISCQPFNDPRNCIEKISWGNKSFRFPLMESQFCGNKTIILSLKWQFHNQQTTHCDLDKHTSNIYLQHLKQEDTSF